MLDSSANHLQVRYLSHILLVGCKTLFSKLTKGVNFLISWVLIFNTYFLGWVGGGGGANTYWLANWRKKMQRFHLFLPKM